MNCSCKERTVASNPSWVISLATSSRSLPDSRALARMNCPMGSFSSMVIWIIRHLIHLVNRVLNGNRCVTPRCGLGDLQRHLLTQLPRAGKLDDQVKQGQRMEFKARGSKGGLQIG